MKCKKCGFEWEPHGENMNCPACSTRNALTQNECDALWEEVYRAERIKDHALRAKTLLALAEQDDAKAQYLYGECLFYGSGVTESREDALLWYKSAAAHMHPAAAYRLAICLSDSRYGNNQRQVIFWLLVAAEFGDPDAALELSRIHESGNGVEPSHRLALTWLARSAKMGSADAAFRLTKMYASGDGVAKNPDAARYFAAMIKAPSVLQRVYLLTLGKGDAVPPEDLAITPSLEEGLTLAHRAEAQAEYDIAARLYYLGAVKGNADAIYSLGYCYERGVGVPKSESEARRRYGIAAERGSVEALLRLADCARNGIGGEIDLALALSSYERAAESGNAEALYRLAESYKNGSFTKESLPMALSYYERAAEKGHKEATEALSRLREAIGTVYDKGVAADAEGDLPTALRFFTLASGMGHTAASYALGVAYEEGRGTAPDMKRAVAAYRVAAEKGHLGAIYRLGVAYSEGRGVVCDYRTAKRLLSITAKQGYERSAEILEKMRQQKHKKAAQKIYSISSVLYRRGELTEAIRFRTLAAKLGNVRAMFMLGCHFEFGDGLPMDREKANAWYTRAQRAGFRTRAGADPKGGFLRAKKALLIERKRNGQ